jgi:hypothetical protein
MIVEPDFLDHWKTRMLVRLLGTETAPLCVIRLWAHCQQRKTDRFTGWIPDVLASVCRWDGDGKTLWDAMLQTFIEKDGETVIVHDWAMSNASLISAWENGKKGGRPTVLKPAGNRPVIRPVSYRVTDREDRIDREEKTNTTASPWIVGFGLELPERLRTDQCLNAVKLWLAHKAEKRQSYKPTGLKMALTKWSNEFSAETFPSAVENSIASGWVGIYQSKEKVEPKATPDSDKISIFDCL